MKISSLARSRFVLMTLALTATAVGLFTWNAGETVAADNLQAFQNEMLKRHNDYRAKHGVPPLQLDAQLNNGAQQWANTLASTQQFKHSGVSGQGENLYVFGSTSTQLPPITAEADRAADSWYAEIKSYNYGKPGFSGATGHFTQVVWKSSTKLGCGIASGKFQGYNGRYVVCRYAPPGNVIGAFPQNVLPPKR